MAPIKEKALYVGEGGNFLTDGTPLIPGETIALVPAGEAEASDLWQPVSAGVPDSLAPRNSPPLVPPPPPSPPPAEVP
jgi:hypothetical protein